MVWLVLSFGREANAAVMLAYEPFFSPLTETKVANCGGIDPLSGCALTEAVAVDPDAPEGVPTPLEVEDALTLNGTG